MKIKLNIQDRITIMQKFIPDQSNIVNMMIWKKIVNSMILSEDDIKAIKLETRSVGQMTTTRWDADKGNKLIKEVDFDDTMIKLIRDRIKELDEHDKVGLDMIDTISKFYDISIIDEDSKPEKSK